MPRWIWFVPVGLLTLVGALYAFRLGWIAANITETDVINAYAARYLDRAGPGARPEDCQAYPARDGRFWITVACRDDAGREWRYSVNRFGGLVAADEPGIAEGDGT